MKMVATDGHRLAKIVRTLDQEGEAVADTSSAPEETETIVPPKALNHLVKLISSNSDLNAVSLGENHIVFDLDITILFSRVIEGPYPDFEQVIPKANEKKLVVAKDTFIPALKRVSVLSNSQTHQIRMTLKDNSIELSAVSQDIGGEAREVVVAEYADEHFEIAYNANYLLEILRKMDSNEVIFELDSPATAGVIKPVEQPEGQEYLCLIMPLRLNG
jgi:DNA polymerase-3 subunit beta